MDVFPLQRGRVRVTKNEVLILDYKDVAYKLHTAFRNFCETTSVHGFKHFAGPERSSIEVVLWVCLVCLSAMGAVIVSLALWTRYQENPTVISMERNYEDWKTPFPAATFCPKLKHNTTKVAEFVTQQKIWQNNSDVESFVMMLCQLSYSSLPNVDYYKEDYFPADQYLKIVGEVQFNLQYRIYVSTEEQNASVNILTENGICHSFNSEVSKSLSLQPHAFNESNYLARETITYGNPLDDFNIIVSSLNSGIEVALGTARPVELRSGGGLGLVFTALAVHSAPEVRMLRQSQRNCRFPDEDDGVQSLCIANCRRRRAISFCHCAPFFYGQAEEYRVCDLEGMKCLVKYIEELTALKGFEKTCRCLSPCDSVNYLFDVIEGPDQWNLGTQFSWGFGRYPHIRLKRDVIFGVTDLLVSTGGTIGLFLGCSVLSVVETVYLATLSSIRKLKLRPDHIKHAHC